MKKYLFLIALLLLVFVPEFFICLVVVIITLIVVGASIGLLYIAFTQSPYDSCNKDD